MEYREICIVMIAHNQSNEVQIAVKNLKVVGQNILCKLVVVDNGSEDGLDEWLKNQKEFDYILCENEVENYADILNTVIREFCIDCDLMLLNPGTLLVPGCLEALQQALYREKSIGAVCPVIGATSREKNLEAVTKAAEECQNKNCKQVMSFNEKAALIKFDFLESIGEFDNKLILPSNIAIDYSFRGRLEGFQFLEVEYAFLYQIANTDDIYTLENDKDVDRKWLKEKWQMNYFGYLANETLLRLIVNREGQSMNILEIGCDCGENLLYLSNRFPDARLFGAEINPMAAKIAATVGNVVIADIDQKNLQFNHIEFDYIFFGDVLEHLRDPKGVLEYCRDLLKEDGRILACIPNLMHFSVMMELFRGNFTYKDYGLLDRTHIHLFTYKEILRMFQEAGYQIEQMECLDVKKELLPEWQEFIDKLMVLSQGVEEHEWYAYQYFLEASKI